MSELDLLRSLPFDAAAPSPKARAVARAKLLTRAPRRRSRVLVPAAGLVAAGTIVVLISISVHGGGNASAAPILRKVAQVARKQPRLTVLKPGQLTYTKSIQAFLSGGHTRTGLTWYILTPEVRETWLRQDGSGLLRSTFGRPQFPTETDRKRWIASGRPDDKVTHASDKLPPALGPGPVLSSDPDTLYDQLHDRAVGHGTSTSSEMFTLVGDSLRFSDASPAVRAALYEVAARISGVELVGRVRDRIGRPGVAVAFSDSKDHERHRLIIDPKTSELLEEDYVELGGNDYDYPVGTLTGYATYIATGVVDRPGARP